MKLMAGNSNLPLARAVAGYLELPLTKAVVRRFADMEIFVEIQENVRGSDAFVIQSTSFPASNFMAVSAPQRAVRPRPLASPSMVRKAKLPV